jgi:hypothetical protein
VDPVGIGTTAGTNCLAFFAILPGDARLSTWVYRLTTCRHCCSCHGLCIRDGHVLKIDLEKNNLQGSRLLTLASVVRLTMRSLRRIHSSGDRGFSVLGSVQDGRKPAYRFVCSHVRTRSDGLCLTGILNRHDPGLDRQLHIAGPLRSAAQHASRWGLFPPHLFNMIH